MMPTPTATETTISPDMLVGISGEMEAFSNQTFYQKHTNRKVQIGTTLAIRMMPTPRARDAHPEGYEAGMRHKEKWSSQTLVTALRHEESSPKEEPNPRWVALFMGFPEDWLDLDS
jgi:hypothetical protein